MNTDAFTPPASNLTLEALKRAREILGEAQPLTFHLEWFRRPRTRKRRILRKWMQNPANWRSAPNHPAP